ncbi:LOW QUALITY PROTEIN: GTP-binding protein BRASSINAZOLE INSENSITIVE PALE GREEN 2, chloroplastic-like [Phalaenopsis equestris]|uniref:LOW QUALITY PROTEIN: GTP-binding protein BRASSINAZOLE INSENSITIVE PALE GREEN 2, chloroplastic-like n=1 Tax=Phalaenopsis equestris TaxID=78828 RepID=UPI0009E378C1|nr:LOW QUALITY PROTEIN: GTP-binding protein BRASSINAZOLE INSENSITIVE PALE GREEN 2, chloroplastic-like [Phalaenopsis equestris]
MPEALFIASATPLTLQLSFNGERKCSTEFFIASARTLYYPLYSTLRLSHRNTSPFCFRSHSSPTPTKPSSNKISAVSEGKKTEVTELICAGCGVCMQNWNPNLPGFYKTPSGSVSDVSNDFPLDSHEWLDELEEEFDYSSSNFDLGSEKDKLSEEEDSGIDWSLDWDIEEDEDSKPKKELDGFALPGVGYGNITSETLNMMKKGKISKTEKKNKMREARRDESDCSVTVCARCHSLRNYGQVKNLKAENLIRDFDFARFLSKKIIKSSSNAPVVVIVVDCVDFDGSFPKRAAKSLFKALEVSMNSSKMTKLPKLVLVANKVDLLPQQISPARLDRWVRHRAKVGGVPKLTGVYLVSARKDFGVRNLLSFIKEFAGPRGNVWVIGPQNAGKSTLINTIAKKEEVKMTRLTEASVPGTTLGIVRIAGILPAKAKMYDTPGLLHPYLMTMRLNREEQKMVEIRKELRPRTYRIKVGQTVHVGGLMRLDLIKCLQETIYVTVWASPFISLHLGNIDSAGELRRKHFGIRLQPPIGPDRATELGEWEAREFHVSGSTWDINSVDLSVSGLGWFSLGLKCEATVVLWTFKGIEVMEREPLVLDRAPFLEKPGFLLPKAVSVAIGNQVKMEAETRKKKVEEDIYSKASL